MGSSFTDTCRATQTKTLICYRQLAYNTDKGALVFHRHLPCNIDKGTRISPTPAVQHRQRHSAFTDTCRATQTKALIFPRRLLVKDLTTVKQGKATTVQDRSEKCLIEERQTLNRWTESCSELYNYKANGDPSVLKSPQTDTEDDHPILRREVEAAVHSLKKEKSAGVENIPAELVQAGGEDVITALTTICNKIWQKVSSHFQRKATFSSARTTEQ